MSSAPALEVSRPLDPSDFEDQAGAFLSAREAENNLMLGMISTLTSGQRRAVAPYFAVAGRSGAVVGAAMRLGLWLIIADGTEAAALSPIVDDALEAQPETPGVVGPKALAREAGQLWATRAGKRLRLNAAERIYRLTRVIAPGAARGAARLATASDRATIVPWFEAFAAEALPAEPSTKDSAEKNANGWIDARRLWVWVDGELCAMAGAGGRTPNGIRVSAVYTRPERRRHGYATSLVAALSQAQLDSGLTYCFLYTDLANPTSNKIYQAIGYEPVCDVDQYCFDPA